MADGFYGTFALGGQVTQEQYARCLELIEPCLEFGGELEDDGSASFSECTEEDFADLVQYCEEQKIAMMLWECDFSCYVEYWIDGEHKQFNTNSCGGIVVSVSDLQENPNMTIGDYIEMLGIPKFPELLIGEPNQQAANKPSQAPEIYRTTPKQEPCQTAERTGL